MMALSQAFLDDGKIEGKRDALRRILHARFGNISDAVDRRIDAADSAQLDDLIDRAVTVERIETL